MAPALLTLLAFMWIFVYGCGTTKGVAPLSVRWGIMDPRETALWIIPLGSSDLVREEVHLKPGSALEFRLLLVNGTHEPVLLEHDPRYPFRYIERRAVATHDGKATDLLGWFEDLTSAPDCYIYLHPASEVISWPTGPLPAYPERNAIYVEFGFGPPPLDTSTMEVTLKWQLRWLSAESGNWGYFDFHKTIKAIYDAN